MQNNIPYRAGLYLRLSKDDDLDGESLSISTQRSILTDYCAANGYTVYKTYVDEAGRKWGYCGYYYGSRNFWVCLDAADQSYEELWGEAPSDEVKLEVEEMPSMEDAEPIVPK